MRDKDIIFQSIPLSCHRRNVCERAIATWKEHFIAGLSRLDRLFPMCLWCLIIENAIKLDLLSPFILNKNIVSQNQDKWSVQF